MEGAPRPGKESIVMIGHITRSGHVVRHDDGRLGLVSGAVGNDGDEGPHEIGVVMRRERRPSDPASDPPPFDWFFFPLTKFRTEFTFVRHFEE